jgi:hypothetical protein
VGAGELERGRPLKLRASIRREEFERVPAPAFVVDLSHVVHVCAGPGVLDPSHAFCGARIWSTWTAHEMSRWCSDWTLCERCGEWAAELEGLAI